MSRSLAQSENPQLDYIEQFVGVIQKLSVCKDLDSIIGVVRKAARSLTGADGATFVLRDGEFCYYADEDAIGPLWKGQKFPMNICISGWAMLNQQAVVVPDIFVDSRIPIDAYRPTFVKSLVMVPIRPNAPVGAIGNYWGRARIPQESEVKMLQALADATSVAMENIQLYSDLRTTIVNLKRSNDELSLFAKMASDDFKEPLRSITTSMALLEGDTAGRLNPEEVQYIRHVEESSVRLRKLMNGITSYLNVQTLGRKFDRVSLREIVEGALSRFSSLDDQKADINAVFGVLPDVYGSYDLLVDVFEQLFSNALKFKKQGLNTEVKITAKEDSKTWTVQIEDNGAGMERAQIENVFGLLQRLHPEDVYPHLGVGLAICRKIIEAHQGRIWAESKIGRGTSIFISFPKFRFSQ